MSKATDAWKDCVAAMREHDLCVSRQRRLSQGRRSVSLHRGEIDDLERERRRHEQDAEIAMLEVLEACGMVNTSWTSPMVCNDTLRGCVQALLME